MTHFHPARPNHAHRITGYGNADTIPPPRFTPVDPALLAAYNAGVEKAVAFNRERRRHDARRDAAIRNLATKAEADGRRR